MSDNKVNLVTTSIQNTWKKNTLNKLLNKSCLPFSKKKFSLNFKYEFGKHPWDKREKFYQDYDYLRSLNNIIIKDLTLLFNNIHGTTYSNRYWKIVFQPWLDMFIHSIFERWTNLSIYFKNLDNYSTVFINSDDKKLILHDIDDTSLKLRTDFFNHHIYKKILLFKNLNNYESLDDDGSYETYYKSYRYKRNKFKNLIVKLITKFNSLFYKKSNFFFIDTYLGKINNLKLSLKLKAFGIPLVQSNYEDFEYNENLRQKLRLNLKNNDFEKFVSSVLHQFIPKSYVENYDSLDQSIKKFNWPQSPKLIFTSHSYREELILFYIAKKKEVNKSKIFFGQHGGSFFQYLFNSGEDYQLNNSDFFLTWGETPKNTKIINIGILKPLNKESFDKRKGKILFVLKSMLKYTQQVNSSSGVNQYLQNLDGLVNFLNNLKKHTNEKNFLFRNFSRYLGLDEEKIFKHYFPNSEHDDGKTEINKLYKRSKLIVHTYYSTGILETLALNYPSIVINDFDYSKFRETAMINIKGLMDVGVIFPNFEMAEKHIISVKDNINDWWFSEKVQKEINAFCKNYAKINTNIVDDLTENFKKEINS